jgi:hypothetical protein
MLSAVFMRDTSNAAVAQWGCTAIYYIARGTNHSILCCLCCLDVPLLVSRMCARNVKITLVLFLFVSNSGADSQDLQHKLVTTGACEMVTKALLKYSEYETISHACFRALVVLLMNNAPYKSKLGALGVCSCVVESMHLFPYSAQVGEDISYLLFAVLYISYFEVKPGINVFSLKSFHRVFF